MGCGRFAALISQGGREYPPIAVRAMCRMLLVHPGGFHGWLCEAKTKVHLHSDQGFQFTSYEWQEVLGHPIPSMRRRGKCWDDAVVESSFNPRIGERIRRKKVKKAGKGPAKTCLFTSSSSITCSAD